MSNYENMTKEQLIAEAELRGMTVASNWTKAAITDALGLDDAALLPDEVESVIPDYDDEPDEESPSPLGLVDTSKESVNALKIVAAVLVSDSRWADMSGKDPAAVQRGVDQGWLATDDRAVEFGRYMVTEDGVDALGQYARQKGWKVKRDSRFIEIARRLGL